MATILKYKSENSPGVIVFTHKERNFFLVNSKSPSILKPDYLLGVHYGWHSPSQKKSFEDFYMGDDNQVSYFGEAPFKIPLNSRNFTPNCFYNTHMRNYTEWDCWDVICVSRAAKFKKLPLLLKALTESGLRGLIIVPTAQNEDEGYDLDIVSKYEEALRKNKSITLLRLSKEHGFMGTNKKFIAECMRRSKALVLMSEQEGESRVIAEGLCSGCQIVTWRHLSGGGRDFLNEYNSESFSDFTEDSVREALYRAVDKESIFPDNLNYQKYFKKLSESYTCTELQHLLTKLTHQKEKQYTGFCNVENLNIRLPAHDISVPWFEGGNGQTADIICSKQFDTFLEFLNDKH